MVMNYTFILITKWLSIIIRVASILLYIHNSTSAIIVKMIILTIKDATTFMRNTAIAILLSMQLFLQLDPIVPAKPNKYYRG